MIPDHRQILASKELPQELDGDISEETAKEYFSSHEYSEGPSDMGGGEIKLQSRSELTRASGSQFMPALHRLQIWQHDTRPCLFQTSEPSHCLTAKRPSARTIVTSPGSTMGGFGARLGGHL